MRMYVLNTSEHHMPICTYAITYTWLSYLKNAVKLFFFAAHMCMSCMNSEKSNVPVLSVSTLLNITLSSSPSRKRICVRVFTSMCNRWVPGAHPR